MAMRIPGKRKQGGVALITVMLVVVVATVLAVQMTNRQSMAVRRAASIFDNEQAREYTYGGEELARQILHAAFMKESNKTTMVQPWASKELDYDFQGGHVSIHIEDLQGRLNINSLVGSTDANAARQRFASLFAHLGVDPMFLDRIVDWIDLDQAKHPAGAEDYDYLGLEHPYRAANQDMVDESELRLLLDMDAKSYAAIAPYVCALPAKDTDININTAPAPVLQAIIPNLPDAAAAAIVSERESGKGYDNVQVFLADPSLAIPAGTNKQGLGVQSSWFEVSVTAQYGDRYAYLTSIIERDATDGSMRVIYRDLGKKIINRS